MDIQTIILCLEGYPVLTVGHKSPTWKWARVSNLQINGGNKHSNGVRYDNQGGIELAVNAGRWTFEKVLFFKCNKAVHKPFGNIGNHYIDCTWRDNNYGIYANEYLYPGVIEMHSGCDRYTGGHFDKHSTGCIYYEDVNGGGGQIIFDGTIIEGNLGFGIKIKYTNGARYSQCAISIRNIYFENNVNGDMHFMGVRSVRIDDCRFFKLFLIESSVNLYNCAHETGGFPNDWIQVDDKSSLVAYEQRYYLYPNNNIFVNSISYDATAELGDPNVGTSVWPFESCYF